MSLQQSVVASVRGPVAKHGFSLLTILVAGAVTFRTALDVLPLAWENLFSLTVAVDRSLWSQLTDSPGPEPIYRPLPYALIWLQGRVFDLNTRAYLAFNQACWIACAFALYALVHRLSGSRLASLIAGLALLLDRRTYVLLTWIDENQTSLAVLCGLLALVLLAAPVRHPWAKTRWLSVFALLLCSALSKEYGLAFAGAAIVFALVSPVAGGPAWNERRRAAVRMTLVVAAVAGVYLLLRLSLASHTFGHDYCQDQSFFTIRVNQQVCLSEMDRSTLAAQFLYNSGATLIGTAAPWLFSSTGAPRWPEVPWYVSGLSIAIAGFALVGLIKAPRTTLAPLSLVLFQAVLSFMVYRPRNQLVGAAGLYAAAGVGLAVLLSRASASPRAYALRAALTVPVLLALALQGREVARTLEEERIDALKREPCRSVGDVLITTNVIRRVKHIYGLDNPNCD